MDPYERLSTVKVEYRRVPHADKLALIEAHLEAECDGELHLLTDVKAREALPVLPAYAADYLAGLYEQIVEPCSSTDRRVAAMRTDFLGHHPLAARARRKMANYLGYPVGIMLIGQRGTGKGALVRAAVGSSHNTKLFTVALSGIGEGLAASELFGHRKGAFTSADRSRDGILLTAHRSRGVVYLDDVAECAPSIQAMLLTALEEGVIRPVGSDRETSIGSRMNRGFKLISSVHPNSVLQLRPDLRDRLGGLTVRLPAVRHRGADVLLLTDRAARLLQKRGLQPAHLSRGGRMVLVEHTWPGNVREVFSVVVRLAAEYGGRNVGSVEVTEVLRNSADLAESSYERQKARNEPDLIDSWMTFGEMGRSYAARVLRATGGNISKAAGILGIHRTTLHRLIRDSKDSG